MSTVRSVRLEGGTAGLTAGALDRLVVAEAGEQQSPLPAPRRRVHAPDYHTHTHPCTSAGLMPIEARGNYLLEAPYLCERKDL